MATERMVPIGLTMPFPEMSGAEPGHVSLGSYWREEADDTNESGSNPEQEENAETERMISP